MKKVILSAAVALMSFAASAQVWVGGSLGLQIIDPDYEGLKKILNMPNYINRFFWLILFPNFIIIIVRVKNPVMMSALLIQPRQNDSPIFTFV